ncbi:MAG: hypothetical protein HFI26_17060 [Lachnospiraceae bacterium]|nr:hypothetical protein [Lachnospiraceae bacterium]
MKKKIRRNWKNYAYTPRMTEVYYLPIRNLADKLDGLSDEAYDAMREHGSLIWSGMSV